MKGTKMARALRIRRAATVPDRLKDGEDTMPGSQNPRKGYAAAPGRHRRVRVAPQGGGNPSRRMRRTGTKSIDRDSIRGRTRGAVNKARKAIRA